MVKTITIERAMIVDRDVKSDLSELNEYLVTGWEVKSVTPFYSKGYHSKGSVLVILKTK
jgi:hypothetical protein